MTTVVFRDGVLATDSQVNASGVKVSTISKCWRTDDGSRWAFAGKLGQMWALKAWSEGARSEDPPKCIDSTLVHITPAGACRELTESGWIEGQEAPYLSWGSGEQIAIGALAMGASAAEAVRIACQYDHNSGLPVLELKLDAIPAVRAVA